MSKEKDQPSKIQRAFAVISVVKELTTGGPSLEEVSRINQQQATTVQEQVIVTKKSEQSQTPEDRHKHQREEDFKTQMQDAKAFKTVQQSERDRRKSEAETSLTAEKTKREVADDPQNKKAPQSQQAASSSRIQHSVSQQQTSSGHKSEQKSERQEETKTNDQQQKR